jgi:hypothetical protein
MGGGSREGTDKNSATYEAYKKLGASPIQALQEAKQAPLYWGKQPIVEAPAYVGAVVLFLFVLTLFLVKGRLKWWIVGGTILSLVLSWGKNFGFLTDFFIDYIPMYNKFRAVSSIQVLLELCIPVLAIIGLSRLFNDSDNDDQKLKTVKYTTIIVGGLTLIFLLFGSSIFSFVGDIDGQLIQAYGHDFINAIREDRISVFKADTLRTLVLVLLSAGAIYMFLKKKLSKSLVIVVFAVLILFDLVGVDRRYVNNDNFVAAIRVKKPYKANSIDLEILKDKSSYRVFDVSSESGQSPAKAAYFHNSLGGYHAAKLGRYDELYDFYISRGNENVLNMLNTKYIIADGEKGKPFLYPNPDVNGNAWFISELKPVGSANEEIKALDSLNTKQIVIFPDSDISMLTIYKTERFFQVDSLASINLKEFKPNYLKYESVNSNKGFAVFSEIYYGYGWNAYIDKKLVAHQRVNYVLRGMEIPAGKHTIEYKFEPQVVKTGSRIALGSSIVFGLLLLGGLFFEFRKK